PEYLSRCEAGEKVMASNAEKMLRLNVLLEPFYMIKASEEAAGDLKYTFERLLSQMAEIRRVVQEMKIVTAADVAEAIVYRFCRKKRPALATGSELAPANDDDDGCEWLKVA
ncbi:MAG TPA: hypothetical protein VGP12_10530, partial [Nitrosospira sp.]|nr:hypothetical protein [Nitrosospira sp.]